MQLKVQIRMDPLPDTLPPEKLDEILGGEVRAFEAWFLDRQRKNGNPNPSPLIGVETGIVKTYILYLVSTQAAA